MYEFQYRMCYKCNSVLNQSSCKHFQFKSYYITKQPLKLPRNSTGLSYLGVSDKAIKLSFFPILMRDFRNWHCVTLFSCSFFCSYTLHILLLSANICSQGPVSALNSRGSPQSLKDSLQNEWLSSSFIQKKRKNVVTRCTTRCHSLCHSLSLVVTRCTRLSFYKQSFISLNELKRLFLYNYLFI